MREGLLPGSITPWLNQGAFDRVGEASGVGLTDEDACIADQLSTGGIGGGDYRFVAGHRFQGCQRPRFARRWCQEDVGRSVEARHRGPVENEASVAIGAKPIVGQRVHRWCEGAVAGQDEGASGSGYRLDSELRSLLWGQGAYNEYHGRLETDRIGFRIRPEEVAIDSLSYDLDPKAGYLGANLRGEAVTLSHENIGSPASERHLPPQLIAVRHVEQSNTGELAKRGEKVASPEA